MVSILSPLVFVDFLDGNYRYKSVATQIPHNTGLAVISYTDKIPPPWKIQPAPYPIVQIKQYTLNHVYIVICVHRK